MGSQKQHVQSKRIMNINSETELRRNWAFHDELLAYEISSEQKVDNQNEHASSHDQHSGVAARDHHRLPSDSIKSATSQTSSIADRSTFAFTEDLNQPKMLIPPCENLAEEEHNALMYAVRHPPVTTASLNELNLNLIIHNINLRSDINFEHDLHFMPVGGKCADIKREECQEYWLALAAELQLHLHARLECPHSYQNGESCALERFTPRLRQMFTDLRELLGTLVPDADHVSIAENLDVPFLMQQIENGVLDISRLAQWLASLLKSHCAPMRDEWADQMKEQIEEGARKSDMGLLVKGIEKLFSFLEAMKLDVANHQIRTFRFQLMEDTIPFLQKFFAQRIMEGKVDSVYCRDWYDEARQRHSIWSLSVKTAPSVEAYAGLFYGMVVTLFTDAGTSMLPKSFQHDLKRLDRLRSSMQDLVHLKIGLAVFDELLSLLGIEQPTSVPSKYYAKLQLRMLAIINEQLEDGDPWRVGLADVALEVARAACKYSGHSVVVVPESLIQHVLYRLTELRSGRTPASAFIWRSLQEELINKTIHHAQFFNDMTPLGMLEAQQPRQQQQEQRTKFRRLPDAEDVARRLAHVGILHWKIWANLVYLDDAEQASPEPPDLIRPASNTQTWDCEGTVPHVSNSMEVVME